MNDAEVIVGKWSWLYSWFQKLHRTRVSDTSTVTTIRQQMLRHCSPVSHESLSLPHEPLTFTSTAPVYATTSDLDRWTLIRDSDPAAGWVAPVRGWAEAINDAARCISKRRYWSIIACPGHNPSLTFWPMTSTDLWADSLPTVRHTLTGVESRDGAPCSSVTELYIKHSMESCFWFSNRQQAHGLRNDALN